ncbi:MAG TPA: 2-C-methyl-D-erythritol 4-phosphate cytidylyltransferase [Spirochaetota bacterium]|nr:2-C-methyl-D-erythritol 4-phosphate cytidylyltransferase [Spirochaetota bacterium]
MATYAIILAGGTGTRLGGNEPKQFLPLGDKPVITWSLLAFENHPLVDNIITVLPEPYHDRIENISREYAISKYLHTVKGGDTRQQSSWNAIQSYPFDQEDILLFHDAARPFVNSDIITNCIIMTGKYGAAGVYVPAIDTITEIREETVQRTLDRNFLHYTQTPQSFKYSVITDAHMKSSKEGVTGATDDISLVRDAGYRVYAVEGSYSNIKITTQHDYKMARWLCGQLEL